MLKKVVFLSAIAMAASASAGVVTYTGADNGAATAASPRPNSVAARDNFMAAAGSTTSINFQLPAPAVNPTNVAVAPGVTLTVTGNVLGGIVNGAADPGLGYNSSGAGNKWLQMFPAFNSSGAVATFNFATGIDAFGLYLSGTENAFPGLLNISFNDGALQSYNVSKNSTPGLVFFGFTDFGKSITSVSVSTGTIPGSTRDVFGIDDVLFSLAPVAATDVPEPMTMGLAMLGLAAMGAARRRRA